MASTQASKICAGVDKKYKKQAVTLAKAVLALQDKVEQQLPIYESMPLYQVLTTAQGESAIKQNPAVAEFRAMVRDYATALKNLQDIVENNKAPETKTSLTNFRAQLKVVNG